MGHLLIIRKNSLTNQYEVLLQRRGKNLREAFHWGVPGGGFDRSERTGLFTLQNTREDLQLKIGRRAALRETIEECGGGYFNNSSTSTVSSLCQFQTVKINGIKELDIPSVSFQKITIPSGILDIVENEHLTYPFRVKFGDRNKSTVIFMYILNEEESESEWHPRAIPHYRSEIDEKYTKGNCHYGYVWVNFEELLAHLERPVPFSSSPLCRFILTLFLTYGDQIRSILDHHQHQHHQHHQSNVNINNNNNDKIDNQEIINQQVS